MIHFDGESGWIPERDEHPNSDDVLFAWVPSYDPELSTGEWWMTHGDSYKSCWTEASRVPSNWILAY